jgi:GTP-binding protein
MPPLVAIIGRPNVGKSTLFNRLTRSRRAIVESVPGVTRDLNMGDVIHRGRVVTLIDTGGFEPEAKDDLLRQVLEQTDLAIEDADLLLLLFDAREGVTPADEALVARVRRAGKPALFVANKIDAPAHEPRALEFFRFGAESVFPLSAEHGQGVSDLLDAILAHVPGEAPSEEEEHAEARIAVVGRPNVGKSSLVNRLLGYARVVVSETPGTTRDAIDTPFRHEGRRYVLVDTAGIRRKSHISARLEKYSVVMALRSLERCDVALVLIDATEGLTDQDARIASLADERGRGLIFLVNKWDRVEKDDRTAGQVARAIQEQLRLLSYAPVLTISAKTGQRVSKILDLVDQVVAEHRRRIPTPALNKALAEAAPLSGARRAFRIAYATQKGTRPPTFLIFGRGRAEQAEPVRRYVVNRLREEFGFVGTPIRVALQEEESRRQRRRSRAKRGPTQTMR